MSGEVKSKKDGWSWAGKLSGGSFFARYRYFLLVLSLFTFHFSLFTSSAADTLDTARQALRDGLWEVARTNARKSSGDLAKIVVLESYAREDKWQDVLDTVSAYGETDNPEFLYYKAAALYPADSR